MPKVSVIIPSYNHQQYVKKAIESVLEQTYQNFEIIITDDGSKDKSVEQIQQLKDKRITLFQFARNRGASLAMNNCIKHAKGEYISVLNSDDLYLPKKLEAQVNFLNENKKVGAVFALPKFIDQRGKDITGKHFYQGVFTKENRSRFRWLNEFFHLRNSLCHPSVLIRKECYDKVGLLDPKLAQLPDFDFWVRLCMKYEIHILNKILLNFRISQDHKNISAPTKASGIRIAWELNSILNNYQKIPTISQLIKIFPQIAKNKKATFFIPFYLARISLKIDTPWHKEFSLRLLDTLLSNKESAKTLRENYHFSYSDFIKLTGSLDIYRREFIAKQENTIKRQQDEMVALNETNKVLVTRINRWDRVFKFRHWDIFRPLRNLINRLLD